MPESEAESENSCIHPQAEHFVRYQLAVLAAPPPSLGDKLMFGSRCALAKRAELQPEPGLSNQHPPSSGMREKCCCGLRLLPAGIHPAARDSCRDTLLGWARRDLPSSAPLCPPHLCWILRHFSSER